LTKEAAHAWILDRGFDPDFVRKAGPFEWTPFHQAVFEGDVAILDWLFLNGASEDIKRKDAAGISPLALASMRNDLQTCRWLQSHGAADVYKYDPYK